MVSRESRGRIEGRGVAGDRDTGGGFVGATRGVLLRDLVHCARLATKASASFRGPKLYQAKGVSIKTQGG